MREATPTLDTVVCQAVDIPDPADRAAYLARACGPDVALRARAAALVAAHFRAGDGFLERAPPPADSTVAFAPAPDEPRVPGAGAAVGPYRLLELVGEGGMGLVFVAEQTAPVRRKVALKVIKPGMDSRQVVARFEQERQALALMDHPYIAKVLDAGTTAGGLPYFAMELVRGLPVTRFCDDTRLPLADRLRLFAHVCRAVQHAHTKGVIHRDLKPSNVLVGEVDGRPVPKVIDFGIAKATAGPLTDRTLHTGHHQFVGTPQYMSPEQAAASGVDVDTRSDVYSLGVLLYELVTGGTPVDPAAARGRGLDEVRRMVREDDPPRPSKRLSTLDAKDAATVADARRADPARLARQVRGELDWVVMAALEKDRGRRYQSPAELAADVDRYLADQPVQAAPPSAAYRLRKFARRNRTLLATAGVVGAALVAGMVGTTAGLLRAEQRRADAEAAQRNEAAERKYAQAIADFVKSDFLALTSVEGRDRFGGEGLDRTATLLDLLNRAADKLKGRADLDPRTEAELCWMVGVNFRGVGEAAKGVPFLERAVDLRRQALGEGHADTVSARISLGVCYRAAGRPESATALEEETLRLCEAAFGADHPLTLSCLGNLAEGYRAGGKLDLALPLFDKTLRLRTARYGPGHDDVLVSANNLAIGYEDAGKPDLALPLLRETLRLRRSKHPPAHTDVLVSMNNLAACCWRLHRLDEALALLEELVRLREQRSGRGHPDTVYAVANLGVNYKDAGRVAEAVPLLEEAYRASRTHPTLRPEQTGLQLLDGYLKAGKGAEAGDLVQTLLADARHTFPKDGPQLAQQLGTIGLLLLDARRWTEAEPLFRESLSIRERAQPDSWSTFNMRSMLGGALLGQMRYRDAEPLLIQGYEGMRQREASIPPGSKRRLAQAAERVAQLCEATGKPEDASKWRAERDKHASPNQSADPKEKR